MSSCRRCGDVFFMAAPFKGCARFYAALFLWLTPFLGFWFLVSMATPFLCFWFLVSMATPFNFVEGCARFYASLFLWLTPFLGFYGCAVSGFLSFKLFKV